MKIRVTTPFRDINDFSRVFRVGEIIDVTEERAERIQKLMVGEIVKEEATETELPLEQPAPEPTPKKKRTRKTAEE